VRQAPAAGIGRRRRLVIIGRRWRWRRAAALPGQERETREDPIGEPPQDAAERWRRGPRVLTMQDPLGVYMRLHDREIIQLFVRGFGEKRCNFEGW
jgi:hypothetical protein